MDQTRVIRKLPENGVPMELRSLLGYAGIMGFTAKPQAGDNQDNVSWPLVLLGELKFPYVGYSAAPVPM